ncbi:MAG: SH3 domain-containing protein [Coriobacteriia bacterium]|nr:SH3 domain-containing protein [Coriobacteriia bacterium]
MRTDHEPDPGYEEQVIPTQRDPYADLYHDEEQPLLLRAVRIVIPWIALIAVITVVLSFWSEFKFDSDRLTPQGETTSTVEPGDETPGETTGTVEPTGGVSTDAPYVRVKADGLNLRTEASTQSDVIKKLPGGTILAYIESGNGWYHVRDDAGAEGWVAAGGSFTELVEP